jgi:hypothetical protein
MQLLNFFGCPSLAVAFVTFGHFCGLPFLYVEAIIKHSRADGAGTGAIPIKAGTGDYEERLSPFRRSNQCAVGIFIFVRPERLKQNFSLPMFATEFGLFP